MNLAEGNNKTSTLPTKHFAILMTRKKNTKMEAKQAKYDSAH